jgi:hypothetical protein
VCVECERVVTREKCPKCEDPLCSDKGCQSAHHHDCWWEPCERSDCKRQASRSCPVCKRNFCSKSHMKGHRCEVPVRPSKPVDVAEESVFGSGIDESALEESEPEERRYVGPMCAPPPVPSQRRDGKGKGKDPLQGNDPWRPPGRGVGGAAQASPADRDEIQLTFVFCIFISMFCYVSQG